MEMGLQDPGATCDDCRWKIEMKDCPWSFDYDNEHPYAEDCCDFRNANSPESAFDNVKEWHYAVIYDWSVCRRYS